MTGSIAACFMVLAGAVAQTAPPFEQMPKIDAHAHYFDEMPEFVKMLQRIDMKVVVICVFKNRPQMLQPIEERAEYLAKTYGPTIHFASTFDLSHLESPEFATEVNAWLDKSFDAGAVMTKIWKEVGMQKKRADGTFVMPDAVELDAVYAHLEQRGRPLMAHFGDPLDAWLPLGPESVHYKYFTNNPEWYLYGREGYPSHADIMVSYDRMLEKHPGLTVIGAHLGSLERDLDALALRLDRFPNFNIDVSARTPDLHHYSAETLRNFFIKYQDRILYGLDQGVYTASKTLSTEEQIAYATQIEEWYRHEYEFYAGPELALPREVLDKFYHGNAERLLPALK